MSSLSAVLPLEVLRLVVIDHPHELADLPHHPLHLVVVGVGLRHLGDPLVRRDVSQQLPAVAAKFANLNRLVGRDWGAGEWGGGGVGWVGLGCGGVG